jgi:hypothetical protein
MKRGIYVPNNPPCVRCPLWNRKARHCIIDEIGCEKILQYRSNMNKRAAVHNPGTLEDKHLINDTQLQIEKFVLDESLRSILPEYLLEDYAKMTNGKSKEVSPSRKRRIRQLVREYLEDEQI